MKSAYVKFFVSENVIGERDKNERKKEQIRFAFPPALLVNFVGARVAARPSKSV